MALSRKASAQSLNVDTLDGESDEGIGNGMIAV